MTSQTKGRSFGHIVPLGRLAGIRIGAHWSLALVLVLLAALLANNQFPATAKGHATSTYWLLGIGTSVVFMASLVAHELAHAVVARRYGIRVEGMTLWMLGGLTKLDGEPKSAKEDFWIAASGPITTLVLAAGYGGLAAAVGFSTALGAAFSWLCAMSVVLGVFNLIPATPLDGGRILRALVWRVTGDRARAVSAAGAAGGIFGALLIGYGLFSVLAGNALGLWLAIIGWFIMGSSRAERWVDRSSALAGLTAGDAMVPASLVCPDHPAGVSGHRHRRLGCRRRHHRRPSARPGREESGHAHQRGHRGPAGGHADRADHDAARRGRHGDAAARAGRGHRGRRRPRAGGRRARRTTDGRRRLEASRRA
jgi:Zn-dependent protease